jgi:hypothetical protein
MKMSFVLHGCWALALAATALPSGRVAAQTSTGSIRGTVRDSAGAPLAGAEVIALNPSSGVQRTAATNDRGFYSHSGLTPANYQLTIRRIGHAPATRPVRVQVGQVLTLDFRLTTATVQLEEVVVEAPAAETQTAEVATNVTEQQIEALPSSSRNFLDLAPLAPSVRVTPDRINGTSKTFASGASSADNVNVFVDGQSYKNDIIAGGVIGQDASRGNPFPRNAVQEFRIITNNFKAEYQKSSSAIITAATRSGGNEWQGSLFTSYQNKGLVALDSIQRKDKADTNRTFPFTKPDYSRVLAGGSVGGPLIRDRLFFFGAYEGNFQNRAGVTRLTGDPSTWPAPVAGFNLQSTTAPFRSHLGFAKLSYNLNEQNLLELNGNLRIERDRRSFGGLFSENNWAFQAAENFKNNVVDGGLKHTYFGRNWTNEARVSYQWYQFNPEPLNPNLVGQEYQGIGRFGGRDTRQDLTQNRLSLRNDWTYSGFQSGGSHVIKLGATVDFLLYRLNKQINENPVFVFNNSNGFAFPVEARYGFGNPFVRGRNTQFGVYAQDDWNPTPQLTINAGIRWDLETGMFDQNFVTPPAVRDSITAALPTLFVPIDPARYFTDGTQRKNFYGAFQPRLGFSYAINEARTTTIFGAAGIFYDRFGFNSFIDEAYRRQHPTFTFRFSSDGSVPGTIAWDPSLMSKQGLDAAIAAGQAPPQEVFLVPNDLKPPKSYQWNIGVRQAFGDFLGSVAYAGSRGRNGYTYEWANLTLNPESNDCCITANLPAYQNILVGNNAVRSWYDALEVKIDRTYRFRENGGWGAGIAYTLSWADAESIDLFTFPQVGTDFTSRHPITDDQRHRVVGNWVLDLPFLWGVQFSGLVTYATGKPFNIVQFVQVPASGGGTVNQRSLLGFERGDDYSSVDLRLRKDFPAVGGTRFGVTADLFNLLNSDNLGCFDETFIAVGPGGAPDPNERFGNAGCTVGDARRFQLGFQYDF